MKSKSTLIIVLLFSTISNVSGQSQANCNNLYLDTVLFYITPQQDSIVSGNLYYNDTTITVYPALHLILADTSIITSPDYNVLSYLDSGNIQPFEFKINFKTTAFTNNTIVNGLFHIYDSDWPGDSIVTCYFPITIVLQNSTSIYESQVENILFKVYPNPSQKLVTIAFENLNLENCELNIYDTDGKLVRTIANITTSKVEIEKNSLSNGLYYFQLHHEQQIIGNGKFVFE